MREGKSSAACWGASARRQHAKWPGLLGGTMARKPGLAVRLARNGWNFVKSPAVAAALGAFMGFIATQAAEYWRENRKQNTDLMLAELADGRKMIDKLYEDALAPPETSVQAAKIVDRLRHQ